MSTWEQVYRLLEANPAGLDTAAVGEALAIGPLFRYDLETLLDLMLLHGSVISEGGRWRLTPSSGGSPC